MIYFSKWNTCQQFGFSSPGVSGLLWQSASETTGVYPETTQNCFTFCHSLYAYFYLYHVVKNQGYMAIYGNVSKSTWACRPEVPLMDGELNPDICWDKHQLNLDKFSSVTQNVISSVSIRVISNAYIYIFIFFL